MRQKTTSQGLTLGMPFGVSMTPHKDMPSRVLMSDAKKVETANMLTGQCLLLPCICKMLQVVTRPHLGVAQCQKCSLYNNQNNNNNNHVQTMSYQQKRKIIYTSTTHSRKNRQCKEKKIEKKKIGEKLKGWHTESATMLKTSCTVL